MSKSHISAFAMTVAFWLDNQWGEPPARFHPVVSMGNYLRWAGERVAPLRREARRTPSPNSGWPMAAMALVLGVCLNKPGVYVLNPSGRPAEAVDTALAIKHASRAIFVHIIVALLAILLIVKSIPQ